jgi:hypothetical protein
MNGRLGLLLCGSTRPVRRLDDAGDGDDDSVRYHETNEMVLWDGFGGGG